MLRWNAVDSAMGTVAVVIDPESGKLAFEVKLVPEQYLLVGVRAFAFAAAPTTGA